MTEENIIRELYMKFDEENNIEEEEEVNPNEPNMVLRTLLKKMMKMLKIKLEQKRMMNTKTKKMILLPKMNSTSSTSFMMKTEMKNKLESI